MGEIRILPDVIVSKISAGEVVERPASVVKELIENSMDASSDKIKIFFKSGGKKQIMVVDNGIGMSRDDALMSLERHATSKIKGVEDLFKLKTLGFRGEALPSVSSVSRFRLITKTFDKDSGTEIYSEGGIIKSVRDIGCNTGSTIEVNNLFYNTPVRLKFLKKPQTELRAVMEIIQREAISRPDVSFEIYSEGKNIYNYRSANLEDRISQIIPNIELYPFELKRGNLIVSGFLSSPLEARSSMQKLYSYVNNRPVKDRYINRSIMDSYGNIIEKGKFPQGVVFIQVDNEDVDVNVHPTKIEVKFKNQYFIGECIKEAIRGMLNEAPWIKGYKKRAENALRNFYKNQQEKYDSDNINSLTETKERTFDNRTFNDSSLKNSHATDKTGLNENIYKNQKLISHGYFSDLKIVGQIGKLYLVCETEEGMIVIDQHAAHERVNFEKIKSAYLEENKVYAQELLIPEVVELTPQELNIVENYSSDILKLGFNYELFGERSIRIRSVPGFLINSSYKDIFLNLLNEINDFGDVKSIKEKLDLVCATLACHSSIRANQKLSNEDIKHLFADLDNSKFPHSCPHGRPIATEISFRMLEKLFKRT